MNVLPQPQVFSPTRIFEGQDAYVVGGGWSLKDFRFGRLRGRRCIATNVSAYRCPSADVLAFSDRRFAERHRSLIENFQGRVISTSRAASAAMPGRVEFISTALHAPPRPAPSSAHLAAFYAIHAGAKRVVLLGCDGPPLSDGQGSHFHDVYGTDEMASDWALVRLVGGWHGWRQACEAMRVEVLNASPMSALKEFRKVDIDSLLGDRVV